VRSRTFCRQTSFAGSAAGAHRRSRARDADGHGVGRARVSDFVERFWRHELGFGGRALAAALAPVEFAFRTGVRLRNAAYTRGLRTGTVVHADVPVVSVGSLLVGGAGKTPFTR